MGIVLMKRETKGKFKPQQSFFVCFTLIFAVAALASFSPFIIFKTSLVWENEGLSQYYTALIYWGKYLRTLAKNLLTGQLVLPQYDFSLGLGGDVLSTLGFYVAGDPFALLSAAVPSRFEAYFASLLAVLRLYAAGFSFGLLAKYKGVRAPYAALGALVYSFCGFALTQGINCQYCINPLIYFPLIVYGIERICGGKRPYVFIISIFLAAAGNVYFFIQLSVFALLFVLYKMCFGTVSEGKGKTIAKLAAGYVLGVLCAAALLLPVLDAIGLPLGSFCGAKLYGLDYYLSLLPAFMNASYIEQGGLSLGFTAAGAFGIILLFSKKGDGRFYKKAFVTCCIFVLLSVFGWLFSFNGSVQNSWVWALALLVAFVFANELQNVKKISLGACVFALAFSAALGVYCLCIKQQRTEANFAQIMLLAVFAGAAFILWTLGKTNKLNYKNTRILKSAFAALCVIAVCTNGLYRFAYTESGSQSAVRAAVQSNASFRLANDFSGKNTWKGIKELQNTGTAVARYDGAQMEKRDYNNAIINNTYGTMSDFAVNNPFVLHLQDEMQSPRSAGSAVEPAFGDPYLEAIENVRYFACINKELLPAGYGADAVENAEKTDVRSEEKKYFEFYENENYVPFGFVYKNVISDYDYYGLNSAEKRLALTKAVVLSDCKDGYANTTAEALDIRSEQLEYKLNLGDTVYAKSANAYSTFAKNAKITLEASVPSDAQLYLVIGGAEFEPQSKKKQIKKFNPSALEGLTKSAAQELLFESKPSENADKSVIDVKTDCKRGSLELAAPRNNNYSGAQSFTVNLGKTDGGVVSVELKFGAIGDYCFENIQLVACDFKNYAADVAALRENTLENLSVETDKISGTITTDEGGWLYLSIPYSEFWSASVDGKSAEIQRANTAFTAVYVDGGTHEIVLEYGNTAFEKGVCASLAGLGVFACVVIVNETALRRRRAKNED